jgi:hypothetical protein
MLQKNVQLELCLKGVKRRAKIRQPTRKGEKTRVSSSNSKMSNNALRRVDGGKQGGGKQGVANPPIPQE